MLDVLRGHDLSDVVAVVTRWFGGVLLGAGGLVRAYSDAVKAGLDEAGVRERLLVTEYDLVLSHAIAGRVESELRQRAFEVIDAQHAAEVTLTLGVDPAGDAEFRAAVAEITAGVAEPRERGRRWVDGPVMSRE